jgi:hypothetical protein
MKGCKYEPEDSKSALNKIEEEAKITNAVLD